MGGLMPKMPAPLYRLGDTVRSVNPLRLGPGMRAEQLDPVAEYVRELPRGSLEAPSFERLSQAEYDAVVAQDDINRANFRATPDQLEFQSGLGQYRQEMIPQFRITGTSSPTPPRGGPQPNQPAQPNTPATRRITPVAPVTGNVLGRTDQSAQPLFGRAGRRRGANIRPPALAPASVTQKTLLGG